jgi:hypothetical protein
LNNWKNRNKKSPLENNIMTGVKHIGVAPVFYFPQIPKSIPKTEKWGLPDEIYKKTGEFSNCWFRHEIYTF